MTHLYMEKIPRTSQGNFFPVSVIVVTVVQNTEIAIAV